MWLLLMFHALLKFLRGAELDCVRLVGLQSRRDLGRNWLAVLPQGNLARAPVYKRIEAPQPRHAEDHWMI